jgi:adenylate kinase family enzyme
MSVISNSHEEDQMMPLKGKKLCFVGGMCSGKSFLATILKTIHDYHYPNHESKMHIMSIAAPIKAVTKDTKFQHRFMHQAIGSLGRKLDDDIFIKILAKRIATTNSKDTVVVDDVRFLNELSELVKLHFTTVRIDTPWLKRLQRLNSRYKDEPPAFDLVVDWFSHESETSLEEIDDDRFDYVLRTEQEIDKFVINMTGVDSAELQKVKKELGAYKN